MQTYATKSANVEGRRDEWAEVKPVINVMTWFSMRMTAKGWKRREGEEGIMTVKYSGMEQAHRELDRTVEGEVDLIGKVEDMFVERKAALMKIQAKVKAVKVNLSS